MRMALHLDGTYFMSFLDADASNRTLPLTDISNSMNLSSNNSTLNNTEAKKIVATTASKQRSPRAPPSETLSRQINRRRKRRQISSRRIRIRKYGPEHEEVWDKIRIVYIDEATNNTITEADNSNLPSDGEPRCVSWKCSQHHHLDTFLTILHYRGCYG